MSERPSDTLGEAKWTLRVMFVLLTAAVSWAFTTGGWIAWLISAVLTSGLWVAARDWVHYRAEARVGPPSV